MVYETRPADIPTLKQRIEQAFVEIRQTTILAYRERLEKVIQNNGGHVEVHNYIVIYSTNFRDFSRNKILMVYIPVACPKISSKSVEKR